MQHVRVACTIAAVSLVCSCAGGGVSPVSQQAALSSGNLVLDVPEKTDAARGKHPAFLSPSATSVSIAVSGIEQPVVADISRTSKLCTTSGATRTCAVPVAAPSGSDTFTATLYDGAAATGAVLGSGTAVAHIGTGAPFSVTLGVEGKAASIALSAVQKQFISDVPASTTLLVGALDAGGNAIAGTYEFPIVLSDSDTTGTFTVSPKSVTSSTTVVTLSYSGGSGVKSATISANGTNVPLTSVSTQVVTVAPPAPFTVSPTSVSLLGTGVSTTVTIEDPSAYTGAYAVLSGNPKIATASARAKTITIAALAAGATSVSVTTTDGREVTIPITITVTALPVQ